jgi:tetratricopeptide (TPR) repeat protein
MRLRAVSLTLVLAGASSCSHLIGQQHPLPGSADPRAALHSSVDWQAIEPHLPDPQTATARQLELAADVLMARRFPEDALDYYGYALHNGGDVPRLLKKKGVVLLEMQQGVLARTLFVRCLQLSRKDAEAWNNLGATDYSLGDARGAVGEYKHALKLNRQSAVYHANLGMAYVELQEMGSARAQFAQAVRIDPTIMTRRESGGMTLRILQSQNFGGLCFEMARMYARQGDVATMKTWLQKASDRGLNLRPVMAEDAALRPWLKDPDVKVMLASSESFRKRTTAVNVPSLGPAADTPNMPD